MGVLGAVVQVSAGPVLDVGHDLAPRRAIAAQPVRDDAPRLVLQTGEQALEEALGHGGTPPICSSVSQHLRAVHGCGSSIASVAADLVAVVPSVAEQACCR
jgi:hypothetical protein